MQTNTAINFLPSIQEDRKLEVFLEATEAVLKLSTWTENLGWTCQKTMRVDVAMLDDLHRVISAARYKINCQKSEIVEDNSNNVISFPVAT